VLIFCVVFFFSVSRDVSFVFLVVVFLVFYSFFLMSVGGFFSGLFSWWFVLLSFCLGSG